LAWLDLELVIVQGEGERLLGFFGIVERGLLFSVAGSRDGFVGLIAGLSANLPRPELRALATSELHTIGATELGSLSTAELHAAGSAKSSARAATELHAIAPANSYAPAAADHDTIAAADANLRRRIVTRDRDR
jgi:hypothetical protein